MSYLTELAQKTNDLKTEFSVLLDSNETQGELRVKLAKAEILLHKIEKLLKEV